MIFRYITDRMSGETILNTCDRMMDKFGTNAYVKMIQEGFDIPFSKFRREFWKSFAKGVVGGKKH